MPHPQEMTQRRLKDQEPKMGSYLKEEVDPSQVDRGQVDNKGFSTCRRRYGGISNRCFQYKTIYAYLDTIDVNFAQIPDY